MHRVFSKDASLGERATALGVAAAMKAKRSLSKIGSSLKKKKMKKESTASKKRVKKVGKGLPNKSRHESNKEHVNLSTLIKTAKTAIKKSRPDDIHAAIKVAVASIKKSKRGKQVKAPRTIKLPTITGGILPLIPIFAGLSALGTIASTAGSISSAISAAKRGQNELEEHKRHNQTMESIAIGNKLGKGFYLRSNKNGSGFYLTPFQKNC